MKKLTILLLLFCALFSVKEARSQTYMRFNLLGWAGVVPNIGFETALSEHWTFLAEGYYSPMWDEKNFKAKGFLITPEVRYYFCEKFNGHYLGVHGNYVNYSKFQLMGKRNIRDGYGYGLGLTYGYTWYFNHHWALDAFIGAGWWHLVSDIYCKDQPDLLLCRRVHENHFNLSRIGLSLAYRF